MANKLYDSEYWHLSYTYKVQTYTGICSECRHGEETSSEFQT